MSDIKAQSRRDAEFDAFLAESKDPDFEYDVDDMHRAYEMGKRHGAEEGPAWHDAPTCAGRWICTSKLHGFLITDIPENSKTPHDTPRRWYGPIHEDEVRP